MSFPFPPRRAAPTSWTGTTTTRPTTTPDWRCTHCNKLLGLCRGGRMHLRFARGHEFMVGFPVEGICRGCGTLNEASSPIG